MIMLGMERKLTRYNSIEISVGEKKEKREL